MSLFIAGTAEPVVEIMLLDIRPEYRGNKPYIWPNEIGCIDAPMCMPAGSTTTNGFGEGRTRWASQVCWFRD